MLFALTMQPSEVYFLINKGSINWSKYSFSLSLSVCMCVRVCESEFTGGGKTNLTMIPS